MQVITKTVGEERVTAISHRYEVQVILQLAMKPQMVSSVLYEEGGQRHAPTALSRERNPAPIVQTAGWAPGPV